MNYANYGTRELKLRLPRGIPGDRKIWSNYLCSPQLNWKADDKGNGGILTLHPYHEPGGDDWIQDLEKCVEAAIHVRQRLMAGDLRALYLLWLCAASDDECDPDEMIEPSVPHGISDLVDDDGQLLWFFGLDPLLLTAAGEGIPSASVEDSDSLVARWVTGLKEQAAKDLLLRLLTSDESSERAKLLAEIRESQNPGGWPTTDKERTLDDLLHRVDVLRTELDLKEARIVEEKAKQKAAKAERERADRLKQMANDPNKWLRDVKRLVEARGTSNYKAAAETLYDLREAVGGAKGAKIARDCAENLVKENPTLNVLKGSLRKRGLL